MDATPSPDRLEERGAEKHIGPNGDKAIVNQSMELFQRQRWGKSWKRGGAHMGFPERVDTILNWT